MESLIAKSFEVRIIWMWSTIVYIFAFSGLAYTISASWRVFVQNNIRLDNSVCKKGKGEEISVVIWIFSYVK